MSLCSVCNDYDDNNRLTYDEWGVSHDHRRILLKLKMKMAYPSIKGTTEGEKESKKKLELYEGFTLCASKLVALCSYCIVCYCWCCYFLICEIASHQETTISCLIQHNLRRGIYSYSVHAHAISFHLPVECIRYVASVTGTVFCVSLMYLLLHRANISLVSRIRIPTLAFHSWPMPLKCVLELHHFNV